MKKPATPFNVTRKVAAELAVASALMIGAGAFAFGPTTLSADSSDGSTPTVMAYRYSPAL